MGNFIAKAWVEIAHAEKRKEIHDKIYLLFKQSEDDTLFGYEECELKKCLSINNGVVRLNMWATLKLNNISYINCNFYANGDEDLAVKLFLELAQMTDTKISGSWTTFNERTILHKIVHEEEDIRRANYLLNTYGESGRATPLELAEAVMRGDVKL